MFSLCLSFFMMQAGFSLTNMYLTVMLKNQQVPYVFIGATMAIFELFGMAGPLCTGAFVDRTGRLKEVVLVSIAMCVALLTVVTKSHAVWLLMAVFCVLGFFLKSIVSLQDTKALLASKDNPQGYSVYRSWSTLGCVFFSLFYTVIKQPDETSNQSILMWYAIGSVLYMATIAFGTKNDPIEGTGKQPSKIWEKGWYDKAFILGIVFIALSRFSINAVTYLSLYMVEELHSDKVILMQAVATSAEFIAMLFSGRLLQKKKISSVTALSIASFAVVLRLVIYVAIPSLLGVAIGQCLHSVAFGLYQPAAMVFVTEHVKKSHRAEGVSICQALGNGLPSMISSLFAGAIIDQLGYKGLFLSYTIPALAAGCLFFLFRKRLSCRSAW